MTTAIDEIDYKERCMRPLLLVSARPTVIGSSSILNQGR